MRYAILNMAKRSNQVNGHFKSSDKLQQEYQNTKSENEKRTSNTLDWFFTNYGIEQFYLSNGSIWVDSNSNYL